MACNGDAPAIFKRCNRLGIPYMAVLASFCLGLLAYLNASSGGAEVFNWLATVTTVNGLLSWSVVLFTYLVCASPAVNQYHAFCPLDDTN